MSILESYISSLRLIKQSGMAVKETSYYGALETLINETGKRLKPSVIAIINTKNIGSGIPDGGLFSKDQFHKGEDDIKDFQGTPPSRGVLEIKGTSENINKLASSVQVAKYLKGYGQVLVTNYYQFLLVGRNDNGDPRFLENYKLSETEKEFWARAANTKQIKEDHEEGLIQFLMRVMLNPTPLSEPKDVAWFVASYAKEARKRIEKLEIPALIDVKKALEESLGMEFSGEKGDHFFKSTLVQTIFYGVFSSWVLFNKDESPNKKDFNWKLAGWYLKVPMIRALFERVANPSELGRLGLVEVLEWTSNVLNRIETDNFFRKFKEAEAVIYFYEPFLEAFDSELRKDLGVWYTPSEVVRYMVEKVDRTLKMELNIPYGLADKRVYVLDPCCGTGAYLVEVLKKINTTLQEHGADALTGDDLKEAAMNRIFGFEILPAPFVVAHLQLGVLLESLGASFSEGTGERPAIYLTNSLTGWEPAKEIKQLIAFPEMQEERDAAEKIKREKPILVILGNPPYNAFAGVSPKEEGELVGPYKRGLKEKWGIGKYNLDDLYIRFFRLAERRIVENSKHGIVCFISNFSFTYEPSFVVMREHLINNFDKIWLDSLNGDSRETGKLTPEGYPDPSIFSTEYNKEGIRKGTTITTLVKYKHDVDAKKIYFRDFWGKDKKKQLLESNLLENYDTLNPNIENKYILRKVSTTTNYYSWPSILQFSFKGDFPAFMESRQGAIIDIEKEKLIDRMKFYFDKAIDWNTLKNKYPSLTKDFAGFDSFKVRQTLIKTLDFSETCIHKYIDRPFDVKWCYYAKEGGIWHRSRPELFNNYFNGNKFLATRLNTEKTPKGSPFYFSRNMIDCQALARNVSVIPFLYKPETTKKKANVIEMFNQPQELPIPNISESVVNYLKKLSIKPDHFKDIIWLHCFAIGYSPLYLTENEDGLKNDFPRIPLPNKADLLNISAELGDQITNLLNTETEVNLVTHNPTPQYKIIGLISSTKKEINLNLTASWGNKTKQGVMPGKGKLIQRDYSLEEYDEYSKSGYNRIQTNNILGETTFDIYINENTFWKNIPERVWNYHIGGYQVIKKWLSYREESIIHRALNKEEIREVNNIARRIAGILFLEDKLNENYLGVKNNIFNWIK